jgi:hypothetical protein
VLVLPAVHPDWLLILDSDMEGREITRVICDGLEVRIEALVIRRKLELAARIIERGLRSSVVLCDELENLLGFISTSATFYKYRVHLRWCHGVWQQRTEGRR